MPDLRIRWVSWLHETLVDGPRAGLGERVVELLGELTPIAAIHSRVESIRAAAFRPVMIGVHLRRVDMCRTHPEVTGNTMEAIEAIDELLDLHPDAGILLCSDDGAVDQITGRQHQEGVRERFRSRYGARVFATEPCSLDRRYPAAIGDALVDLWLLRCTDVIVGSALSSFTQLAAYGRDVPVVLCRAPEPHVQAVTGRLDRLRLSPLLRAVSGRENMWTGWMEAKRLPQRLASATANMLVPGRRERRDLAAIRSLAVEPVVDSEENWKGRPDPEGRPPADQAALGKGG